MQRLIVEKTKSSPAIDFNPDTNILKVAGESYPENCTRFYLPIFEWIVEYLKGASDVEIILIFDLVYFNSSSSKVLLDIFDLLEEQESYKIIVNWIHDIEDGAMQEYGEEFKEDIKYIEFNIIAK